MLGYGRSGWFILGEVRLCYIRLGQVNSVRLYWIRSGQVMTGYFDLRQVILGKGSLGHDN